MVTKSEFENMVEALAPSGYQYSWDNSGWNIIDHENINKVLICLDVTMQIVEEAVEKGCDTILSHHPMLFHPAKSLSKDDPVTGIVLFAAKNSLNVYCAHTSCDCSPNGLNLDLANKLGIKNPSFFIKEGEEHGLGFIGDVDSPVNADVFAAKIKSILAAKRVKYVAGDAIITRAAVIGGSAGEFFREAKEQGAQALVVGDAKYNDFLDAKSMGIILLEAGHFETEVGFAAMMHKGLQNRINELQYNLTVETSKRMAPPYTAI